MFLIRAGYPESSNSVLHIFFLLLPPLAHGTPADVQAASQNKSRYVCVLQDILSAIPLPNLRHSLSQLSADELKKKAIIAARIAHLWNQETVTPQKAYKFECDSGVLSLHLLPGGKWMIIVHFDGTLVLHDFRSELPKVRIVDRTLCDENLRKNVDLRLWACQSGEILAILKTFSGEYYNRCV